MRDPLARLQDANLTWQRNYPGEPGTRQPVHTVYGGAHLFTADSAKKLGALSVKHMKEYAPDAATFGKAIHMPHGLVEKIYPRVLAKLESQAVEDFRIDFEDGYGNRPDEEEDGHAEAAAKEVAKGLAAGSLPPFIGIRIKPFSEELRDRSIRTLDIFLSTLVGESRGQLPANFVVTIPKVVIPEQVAALVEIFDVLEPKLGLEKGALKLEMMIETTNSVLGMSGMVTLPLLLQAARGRCTGAHFGTYDYTASCNITAAYQKHQHPACDFARSFMQVAYASTGIFLSDGATTVMPVAPHKAPKDGSLTDQQKAENANSVHRAWKLHYDDVRHSLLRAYYQGWDLHPGQLPTRYAAVYGFFLENFDAASERLKNFISKAAQATLVGDIFDDAATGQGLLNYFLRGINCGALKEEEALATGVTIDELRGRSFVKILKNRRGK
ncbi:MAG TPA: phosphoenolpyruvate kinase [Planctomycetota bacterium]|nr:phosphoenolpyruvate kinase [Planctomycetota bacterium]